MKSKKKLTPKQLADQTMRSYIKATAAKQAAAEQQSFAKKTLLAFAANNKNMAGEDGNIQLKGGYIHFGEETVIKPCEGFDMAKFIQDYPELIDKKFKVAPMKNVLKDDASRKQLTANHCVELVAEESVDIVIDKKS